MKFAPRLALSVALVSSLFNSVANMPACSAQDAFAAADQDARASINWHIGRLENEIKCALEGGRLTVEEADNYKSALSQIGEEEAEYVAVAGVLGPAMRSRLQSSVSRLEKRFDTSQHDRRVAILDLTRASEEMNDAINQALQDKLLRDDQAQLLLAELKSIGSMVANLGGDGNLSYGDLLIVSFRMDRLMSQFGRALTEPVVTLSVDDAAGAVATALGAAKLSVEQTTVFKKEYDDWQTKLVAANAIKNPALRDQQLIWLASQFELLKTKIDLGNSNKSVAIAPKDRIANLDLDIAKYFYLGAMSPSQAHELRAELQGTITEMGGINATLTDAQSARASLELARIENQLQRWKIQPNQGWPGLKKYQADFLQRVDAALAAGRISSEQQAHLKSEAESIAQVETQKRGLHNGQLEANDALEIAIRIEQLGIELHHDMKDRKVVIPNIDALNKELDRSIAEGVSSGNLVADGSVLNERLAHITELRSNYEKSASGLDDRAKLAVANSIAQTIAVTEQELHHNVPPNLALDIRLDHLGDLVSDAVANGLITIDRGTQYRAAVDTIYAQLAADRKTERGLSASEAIAVANDTDLLTAQINDELRESAVLPPSLTGRIHSLRLSIGNAVGNARLTVNQGNDYFAQLDQKTKELQQSAETEGGLSHGEGLKYAYDIERIKTNFENSLHDTPVAISDISAGTRLIDSKLANGLAAGQLSITEAQKFQSALERILKAGEVFRETDGGWAMPEAIALNIEVDQLNRAVDAGLRADQNDRNVDAREMLAKKRIAQLVAANKISKADGDALLGEVDRIEESEAAFRVSDEGLNYAEALTLALDLDRLSTKLDGLEKGSSISPVNSAKAFRLALQRKLRRNLRVKRLRKISSVKVTHLL